MIEKIFKLHFNLFVVFRPPWSSPTLWPGPSWSPSAMWGTTIERKSVFRNDKGDMQESSKAGSPAVHLLGHLLLQEAQRQHLQDHQLEYGVLLLHGQVQ